MSTENERLQILEMLDRQQITVEQAVGLIAAISGEDGQPAPGEPELLKEVRPLEVGKNGNARLAPEPEPVPVMEPVVEELQAEQSTQGPSFDPAQYRWRSWWWIPMGVGVTITVGGALFMYLAWQASGLGFWFIAACLPFLLGVIVMTLAWASRKARWLHVRVYQPEGKSPRQIAISLPLPLGPLAWFVRIFRPVIPQLQETGLDELILALRTTSFDQPVYIEVNEGANGERVEVYFG